MPTVLWIIIALYVATVTLAAGALANIWYTRRHDPPLPQAPAAPPEFVRLCVEMLATQRALTDALTSQSLRFQQTTEHLVAHHRRERESLYAKTPPHGLPTAPLVSPAGHVVVPQASAARPAASPPPLPLHARGPAFTAAASTANAQHGVPGDPFPVTLMPSGAAPRARRNVQLEPAT